MPTCVDRDTGMRLSSWNRARARSACVRGVEGPLDGPQRHGDTTFLHTTDRPRFYYRAGNNYQ
eukprot:9266215-Pyramimonas_sp.AAC.1